MPQGSTQRPLFLPLTFFVHWWRNKTKFQANHTLLESITLHPVSPACWDAFLIWEGDREYTQFLTQFPSPRLVYSGVLSYKIIENKIRKCSESLIFRILHSAQFLDQYLNLQISTFVMLSMKNPQHKRSDFPPVSSLPLNHAFKQHSNVEIHLNI